VLFADPDAPSRVRSELDAELAAHDFTDAESAVGCAHEAHSPVRVTGLLSTG